MAERGPELIGQPSVVQPRKDDVVYTAPETTYLSQQNKVVKERTGQCIYSANSERQTLQLRQGARAQQAAILAVHRGDTQALLTELREVRRASKAQEYYRLNEQDNVVGRVHTARGWQNKIHKHYRPNAQG